MRLTILALDGLFDTGLTVTLEAFGIANRFAAGQTGRAPLFDVSIVGVRKKVRSGLGLSLPVQAITRGLKPEWVIVPALNTSTPDRLIPALGRKDVGDAKTQLLTWHAQGAHIAAACIGSFVLAETGLLDYHEATTTWWLAPLFRQRYPNVSLDESRMLDGASRSCALADTQGQPRSRNHGLALPARRYPLLASSLHHPQSSGAGRSSYSAFRAMGTGTPQGRVLLAGRCSCHGDEHTYLATPLPGSTGQITARLLSGSARGARAILGSGQWP